MTDVAGLTVSPSFSSHGLTSLAAASDYQNASLLLCSASRLCSTARHCSSPATVGLQVCQSIAECDAADAAAAAK